MLTANELAELSNAFLANVDTRPMHFNEANLRKGFQKTLVDYGLADAMPMTEPVPDPVMGEATADEERQLAGEGDLVPDPADQRRPDPDLDDPDLVPDPVDQRRPDPQDPTPLDDAPSKSGSKKSKGR